MSYTLVTSKIQRMVRAPLRTHTYAGIVTTFNVTISLAWDANPSGDNVTNYNLYYGSASGVYNGVGSPVNVGNVISYELTINSAQVPGFLALKAENASGESAFSNEISP